MEPRLKCRVVYLDVTSSCKSSMNTGVQRMVRGLYRNLKRRVDVAPLLWSPKLRSYCRLSEGELRFLEIPFQEHAVALAHPERRAALRPWSRWTRHLRHRSNRISLSQTMSLGDSLWAPEIFQDNRTEFLPSLAGAKQPSRHAFFHDAIALRRPDLTPAARRSRFVDYIKALARFDRVICVSRESENDLRFYWNEFGVGGASTSVEGWPTDFGERRPMGGGAFGNGKVLCVGTLEPRKNHLGLLEAAERLWNGGQVFELILIGRSHADASVEVHAAIDRLKRRGRSVRWLRHVADEALHQAYRDCSFTVYPSFQEGFGLPILESLWHGRPCICGANGALGETASGGGCLTIDQNDPQKIADAMRILLTDRNRYAQLHAEAGGRKFRTWNDYVESLAARLHT